MRLASLVAAYYGLDVIITVDSLGNFSSNLLEVNFAGNFEATKDAEHQRQVSGGDPQGGNFYEAWGRDLQRSCLRVRVLKGTRTF